MSIPLEAGERILFVDARDRTYLVRLQTKGTFHTHGGALSHDLVIGQPEGVRLETAGGMVLTAFRPRFADYALKMPRGAQVIYPKDLGPILVYTDIYPGASILEAGSGSGALTIALCRAVGPGGRVVSYEVRSEHRERAVANVEGFFGKIPDLLELTARSSTCPSRGTCCRRSARPWSPAGSSVPTCPPRCRSSRSCLLWSRRAFDTSRPSRP